LRFIVVGIFTTLLYFVAFLTLHNVAGFEPIWATVIAYAALILVSYSMHRSWSFQSVRSVGQSLPRYVALQLTCMALNAAGTQTVYVFFNVSGFQISLVATFFAAVISFIVSSLWVFSDEKSSIR